MGPSSARLQYDSAEGPAPSRYVNFLVYMGYSVEILGGKHYKTPDGEFVEMKSGTQYKIHVKNSHDYGKSHTYYCLKNAFKLYHHVRLWRKHSLTSVDNLSFTFVTFLST